MVRFRWWPAVLAVAVLMGGLGWLLSRPEVPAPGPPVLAADQGWADENSCIECHIEAEGFRQTGHAQTLLPAEDPRSRTLLEQFNASPAAEESGVRIELNDKTVRAVQEADGVERSVRLDWVFGSGLHARTWVGTLSDSWGATDLVEFRYSWYHLIDDFAVTPGQPEEAPEGYFGSLGLLYDHPKTRRCFACHSSYLPLEGGRLNPETLKPGVTCQRCHGPQQRHVESGGLESDPSWSWANISRMESIHRCAECHRRAEERPPEDIRPDNPDIARFQPVGLVQSPCFQGSEQMTCMTCHDPHLPLDAQDSLGIWQCVQCHDGSPEKHATCGAGHREGCLSCHMPKVRTDAPLEFTDHWIRIR